MAFLSLATSSLRSKRLLPDKYGTPMGDRLRHLDPQGSELLEKERAQSHIDVNHLLEFLFTKDALARQNKILAILLADPIFDKTETISMAGLTTQARDVSG